MPPNQRAAVERLEREMESRKEMIRQCELVDAADPEFYKLLIDMLEEDIRRFQEFDCWAAPVYQVPGTDAEPLEICRGKARRSRQLREWLISRKGKRDIHLAEAERIGAKLEHARAHGFVEPKGDA